MGFFGSIGKALTAPIKAAGSLGKASVGATKSLVTGHPLQAAKTMGRGAMSAGRTTVASARPITRQFGRGRR